MNLETVHENIDGIILSIHVKNFFCHENLFIDFARKKDENVHSIMGHNGSGKSTILTALVIGLGGRAASTFRGYNLQSFIKRGETTATIKIKIKNSSPRAYKPDIYGDSITIVRTINTTGGSYKIRCVSGAYKSTTASVVKEIVNAHDIQIENPISVLNQDDARSFHGVNAKEKYGAFRRATNFAKIEENYNTAQENCKEAAIKLARKNEAFLELSKEYKRLKMTYDQMKPQEEIENEKRRLHNELKWFDVAKLEAEVEKRNAECERFRSTCNRFSKTLQSIEEKYANMASTLDSLRRPLSEPAARREALERELSEAEAEAHRVADRTRVARTSRNHTRDRLLRERRQATDLAEAIRTVESGVDDGVTRREELERAKEEASAAVAELRARRDTGLHEERQARDHATRAAEEAEKAADALRAQERQLERHKVELAALRQCSADSLAVFGEPVVELCRLVERAVREGRFSQPPRGPVGNFLKVRNKEWASALEHVIGAAMKRFCVNSRSDSNLLFEIMGKLFPVGKKPSVTTTAFRSGVHDVRARRVSAPVGTCALDELEITDHVVANFLIDNLKLETVLLVANHEDAVRLTDSVQNVPANCSKVVTKDCTDYMPASATSSYRIYGGIEHPPRYLNTSTVDRTRQMEAKIAELEKSVEENGSQRAHLARQADMARRAQDRSAKTLHLLQSELRKGERAAKDAEEALQQHSAPRLAVLKENYESCNSTVTKLEAEELQLTKKEQTLEEKKKDAEARVAEVKKELEVVNREYRRLQEEINQKQIKLEQSATEKASYQHRLSEETVRLQREEDALEERRTALMDLQEGLGHRPERLRDKTEVQSQLRLLERQLSAASASTQSRDEVRARLHDATERCTRVRDELDAIKVLIDKNNKIAKNHLKNCYTMQNNIGRHVALKFTNILKLSNYVGHMELDHAEGELELYIANRNTKSLSGGERSYSTVALFMAMWECVELPFYFMDEFDVFMDGVNRKIIWELLVDFAKRRKGRQFVFLTQRELPISKGSIEVHRLGNPRD